MKRGIFLAFLVFISSILLSSCEGKGKLSIDNPKNADVYINGKLVGKTPLVLELKEGKYDITVATSEFDRDTQKGVWVYYDKQTKLSFNPKPTGLLKADSLPQGTIVMEGRDYIGTTPFQEYLPVGKHLIIFKLKEVGTSRKVVIEYGKTTSLFVNLTKAVLHFNTNYSDAKFYIDGKEVGNFPKDVEVDEGLHKVTVEKDVYKDTFDIKVKKGDEFNINYTLTDVQLPPVQAYGPLYTTKDYKHFVSLGKAGIYFWDISDLKPHISLWDPEDVRNFDKFSSFAISDDGKFTSGIKPIKALAYKYKEYKKPVKILVWDNLIAKVVTNKLVDADVSFTAFGKNGNNVYLFSKDGKGFVIDAKTGNKIKDISIRDRVSAVKNYDNKIYIGTESGKLIVFDTISDSVVNTLNMHSGRINDVQISKDGNYIITASNDKTVKVSNISDMTVYKSLSLNVAALSANLSPLAEKVAVAKADKTVDVYNIGSNKLYSVTGFEVQPVSVIFASEEVTITASSVEKPTINLWYNGKLLKKWVQTIE